MQFQLSEEHLMIQKAAKDFAINECLPGVIERDELQKFPKEQIEKLADLGFMGMMVKPEYGGSGMDTISYVLAMEEISKVDASVSVCMSVNNSLVCYGGTRIRLKAGPRVWGTPGEYVVCWSDAQAWPPHFFRAPRRRRPTV